MTTPKAGSPVEVLLVFLRLGVTSFGGPVAHIGYFHEQLVVRRRWLSEGGYADLVALCQFLPGPASSQVGMAIGLQRAGFLGLLAAWTAFTLPSAILLTALALIVGPSGGLADAGWAQGLKAAAVAVVALAVVSMARSLAPDRRRAGIAAGAAILALLLPTTALQVVVIAASGAAGLLLAPDEAPPPEEDASMPHVPRPLAIGCLALYGGLLVAFLVAAPRLTSGPAQLLGVFYRAGALVFGGGHVVLPLLDTQTVATGLVTRGDFLAGYGAAQAVPGPLFTVAAYLGSVSTGSPTGVQGAAVALIGIFLPGALVLLGALPFWSTLRRVRLARRALLGVNAGVVGLLAAALYTPVFTEGITSVTALAIAIAAFVALSRWNTPAWAVVVGAALLGAVLL